jgi:hypothetical protein
MDMRPSDEQPPNAVLLLKHQIEDLEQILTGNPLGFLIRQLHERSRSNGKSKDRRTK